MSNEVVPISPEEQERLVDWFFSANGPHPEICLDDSNRALLVEFLRTHTMGIGYINVPALEFAVRSLAGQLRVYADVDVSAQIADGVQAQETLRLKEEDEEKQRKKEERRARAFAEQSLRGPGMASAYSGMEERIAQEQKQKAKSEKAAEIAELHEKFVEKLRQIEMIVITTGPYSGISYTKSQAAKDAAKQKLASDPIFARFKNEIK